MTEYDPRADLRRYLQQARDALLWKLDGLSEYDARLDAVGRVPHWPGPRGEVTLHQIMTHVVAETHRHAGHAGHADIVRELVDGAVGLREDNGNLPPLAQASWRDHWDRVERAARDAARS